MDCLSVFQLRTYLGASADEIAKLRALFPDYAGDEFPSAECARALLAIRGKRGDVITEAHKARRADSEQVRRVLGGRRRMQRD